LIYISVESVVFGVFCQIFCDIFIQGFHFHEFSVSCSAASEDSSALAGVDGEDVDAGVGSAQGSNSVEEPYSAPEPDSVLELDSVQEADFSVDVVFRRPVEAWFGLLPPTAVRSRGRGAPRGRRRRCLTPLGLCVLFSCWGFFVRVFSKIIQIR
jgi:hypothetical protein